MKTKEFDAVYEQAKKVNVVSDEWFNTMGWFWINLTEKQYSKMVNLMIQQGAEVIDSDINGWNHQITLGVTGIGVKVD